MFTFSGVIVSLYLRPRRSKLRNRPGTRLMPPPAPQRGLVSQTGKRLEQESSRHRTTSSETDENERKETGVSKTFQP